MLTNLWLWLHLPDLFHKQLVSVLNECIEPTKFTSVTQEFPESSPMLSLGQLETVFKC